MDPSWYLTEYSDLAGHQIDAARHYLEHGASEGRNPSPLFDTAYYLGNNPDVAESGMNPLVHFIRFGEAEGRRPRVAEGAARSDLELLRSSSFMDPEWYLSEYSDLAGHQIDPVRHYLNHGAFEGRNPSPLFDTFYYLNANQDVAASGMNPLVHFIRYGEAEGRRILRALDFDAVFYTTLYPEVAESGSLPLLHFHQVGRRKFYHGAFDEEWYRSEYPDVGDADGSLMEHFLTIGQWQARHPSFRADWYLGEYPDVAAGGEDPLSHYRRVGRQEGRHAGFDRNFYLEEYEDIRNSSLDPYEHYCQAGRLEGRVPAFNRAWYLKAYADVECQNIDPYEHYRKHGRAEGRPLSPLDRMTITEHGHPNWNSGLNAPATSDLAVPAVEPSYSPKITVIVPNFNHARYLGKRLDTIYGQTYRNFEVILLDDASSDDSVQVLQSYADRFPEQTTCVFNEKNSGGVFYQWKKGLELAKGDLIWLAESDDYSDQDFLEKLVYFFRNNAVMMAFCRTDFVTGDAEQKVWTSEAYWAEVGLDLGAAPLMVSAHEIVKQAWGARNLVANVSSLVFRNPGNLKLFDDPTWLGLRMCGDWIFYLTLMRGGLVAYTPLTTNYYRQHPQNTSISTHDKDLYYQEHEVVARYLARLYHVDDDVLTFSESVLYRHWCMKRGTECRPAFEELFNLDRIRREREGRKPNVAIAVYALVTGGGETFPILIANLLFARGFAVTVLNFEAEETNEGIRRMLDPAIPIVEPSNSADAGRLLHRLGIELVHSHHGWVDLTLALALKQYPEIRHVVTMHGFYDLLDPAYIVRQEKLLDRVNALVYIADKNLTPFRQEFLRRKLVRKITNTAALHPLSGLTRQDLGISEEEFVVCLASRAVPDKGWREAIEAIILANQHSKRPIRLILVGDGPEAEKLKGEELPPFISLVGFQNNVRDFFALSDIGLIASYFKGESCPLVLIECLSVGKPVVASDIGEVKNMLATDEGYAGAVHQLNHWTVDVPRLAEIIAGLADDRAEYERVRSRVPKAAMKFDQELIIGQYIDLYDKVLDSNVSAGGSQLRLSVILIAYNMEREVPRTLFTLSPACQQLDESEYEVILIDNGSRCSYDVEALEEICPNLTFVRLDNTKPSPVDALNYGISIARGAVICTCIDAARMASPRLLATGLEACELHPRVVTGALSYHLGPEPQNVSTLNGYDQTSEDELLASVDWRANGYELFTISSFDPSSRFGFYECPAETNALFMRRELWAEYGGFDPEFTARGGGLVNLDIWRRVCSDRENIVALLLGEGTFHQVHGGVSTNAQKDPWVEFHAEYMKIRGVPFVKPSLKPLLFGRLHRFALEFEKRVGEADPE